MLHPITPRARDYARTINRLGWGLVIFNVLFTVLSTITSAIFAEEAEGLGSVGSLAAYGLISSITYMAPFIIGGIFFYKLSRREPQLAAERIRFEIKLPAYFPLLILAGLAINTAAAYLNSWFCEAIGYVLPADWLTANYDDPAVVTMYMSTALAPAFAEEFLFRGVIYSNLRPYGRIQAILISSLSFALMHQNIGQTFYTFVCGVVLALMYEWTGSIWCSIFFHMFNNEIAVLTEVLYYGKFGTAAEPLIMLWDILVFALGVISILVLVIYARKKKNHAPESGRSPNTVESFDTPLSGSAVRRSLLTPGSLVFAILTVGNMFLVYFMILLNQALGGGLL